jgi:flagellar hook assembly protein FlgD
LTTIAYDLPTESEVTLAIFNILGQRVRTLVNKQTLPAGRNHAVWDGKNDDGELVSAGLYFYLLRTENFEEAKKMILIR